MMFLEPGLAACLASVAVAFICSIGCFILLQGYRKSAERTHAQLRLDLQCMAEEGKLDWSAQIAQLSADISQLEFRFQNSAEVAGSGLARSARTQAMQLLRSGASPESAAATLGLGRRETRLIAGVSRLLTLKNS